MCVTPVFILPNFKKQSLIWKYRNFVWSTCAIWVTSSWPQNFLTPTDPIHTDKPMSLPGVPPCAQRAFLPLILFGVTSFQLTLPFSEPVSQHQYKRFYLENGNSILWEKVEDLLPNSRSWGHIWENICTLIVGKELDMASWDARRHMGKRGLFSTHSLLQAKNSTCWPL